MTTNQPTTSQTPLSSPSPSTTELAFAVQIGVALQAAKLASTLAPGYEHGMERGATLIALMCAEDALRKALVWGTNQPTRDVLADDAEAQVTP